MNILIVGAGPTGLTAALELARGGVIARVIDKRDSASTLSRAVGITPRSLELLSLSGVDKAIISDGITISAANIYRNNKLCLTTPLHSSKTYFHSLIGLPQNQTEAIIAKAFTDLGGKIDYGVKLSDLTQDKHQVEVELNDNGQIAKESYDYVIGADGVGSQVRQSASIDYPGYTLDETWSIADIYAEGWQHANELTIFQLPQGKVLVLVAIGENRYRLGSNTEDSVKALPVTLNISKINRQATFKISVCQAETYSKGRVYLAGDAAHCHSPVGGRGMNMGIGDACELAKCLLNDNLENYSLIRHTEGQRVISMTERARRMLTSKSGFKRSLFKIVLVIASLSSFFTKRIGRFFVES